MKGLDLNAVADVARRLGGPIELARLAGVHHSTTSRLLAGKLPAPSLDLVVRIAEAGGVGIEALLTEKSAAGSRQPADKSLKEQMRAAGLSQSQVAERTGIAKSTLCEALNGKRQLDAGQREALVKLLKPKLPCRNWAARERARHEHWRTAMREPLSLEVRAAFGLSREPFATVDFSKGALLPTKDYRLAFENILNALEEREFIVLSGPVGVGKTHMLNAALADVRERERFVVCRVQAAETGQIGVATLVEAILGDHGVAKVPTNRESRARLLVKTLAENEARGKWAVVVVDEAHRLGISILKQLKQFHEYLGDTGRPVLAIVLCGQPPLEIGMRRNPDLKEVTWRASCVRLKGLSSEVREYLKHKLQRAGGSIQTWDPAATDELERHTIIPLAVNVVAAKAMAVAFDHMALRGGRAIVKADDVREAAEKVL